ncbi:MAG: hypothetical protein LBK76_04570 [Verrucomicrobiales bacterium]|nr:hypothetical protein [Verrucomicrobiales bacterium]
MMTVTVIFLMVGCGSTGPAADGPAGGETNANIERSLPYIRTAATLAMGAGLRFGVDEEHREKIANLSWSVSRAAWTLTDGSIPTADEVARYLLAFDYELDAGVKTDYALIVNSIAGLYAGYYEQLRDEPALAVKVLNAIAEGAAAGAEVYATVK